MCIVKEQAEYNRRRLAGENVVPIAHIYGLTAIEYRQSASEVMAISIEEQTLSAYIYEIKDRKFRIVSFVENIVHTLSEVLKDDLWNGQTEAWWKAVFYEIDGQCSYDHAYDTLKPTEGSSQGFKDVIDAVSHAFNELDFPSVPPVVCLVGEYSSNPLVRYVLQEKLSVNNSIQLIPCDIKKTDSFEDFPNQVFLPAEKKQATPLLVDGGIPIDAIFLKPITVTFPLSCTDNVLVNNLKWTQLVSYKSPDYKVGNLEFKLLFLKAECDVYGSVFLSCSDLYGNQSIVIL